jgi:drug/metabolite transporter (DMT)-like permease
LTKNDFELLLVTFIWAVNGIAVKDAVSKFLPLQFNVIRLGVAAATLFMIMIATGQFRVPSKKDWPLILLAGVLGNTFYQYLFIKGISMSTASNTSFVLATMPATTAVLSHFMGKQKLTRRMWLGVLLTLVGVTFIILGGSNGGTSTGIVMDTMVGDLITLSGTAGWCLYTVLSADLVDRLDPIGATTWTMFAGVIFLMPLAWPELRSSTWSNIGILAWGELLFSAVFALAVSYILCNRGVKESGPAKTAVFGNLPPVWTGILGWLFLKEQWTVVKFIGAGIILLGVSMVRTLGVEGKKEVAGNPFGNR